MRKTLKEEKNRIFQLMNRVNEQQFDFDNEFENNKKDPVIDSSNEMMISDLAFCIFNEFKFSINTSTNGESDTDKDSMSISVIFNYKDKTAKIKGVTDEYDFTPEQIEEAKKLVLSKINEMNLPYGYAFSISNPEDVDPLMPD